VKQIKGVIFSGSGEAAFFTRLDWVKQQCREKLGFEPYPGTLNLEVGKEDLLMMNSLVEEDGIKLVPPTTEFCEAVCIKVSVGTVKAAAIIPHVDDYYENTIEIIAPVKVKERLNLEDGDELIVTINGD
jgi:CTP-dependent riboflavin kinase